MLRSARSADRLRKTLPEQTNNILVIVKPAPVNFLIAAILKRHGFSVQKTKSPRIFRGL